MKKDLYSPPPPQPDTPADARIKRRAANKAAAKRYYKPRSEMTPEELAKARADGVRRTTEWKKRKRVAAGLPTVGKPGRPRKTT